MGLNLTDREQIIADAVDKNGPSLADLAEDVFRKLMPVHGFSVREGQISMARIVAATLQECRAKGDERVAAIEAPCGSGKSLSYLVPAVLLGLRSRFGRKEHDRTVVISTSNISLQGQIVDCDVPAIEKVLEVRIGVRILKGLQNYICPDKLGVLEYARLRGDIDKIDELVNLLKQGWSGDKEDLPFAVPGSLWEEVSTGSPGCLGQQCPSYGSCPGLQSRRANGNALLTVVNHAYLSVAQDGLLSNGVLGLVADEAHDLEDNLRRSSGVTLREGRARHWRARLKKQDLSKVSTAFVSILDDMLHEAGQALGHRDDLRLGARWYPRDRFRNSRDLVERTLKEAIRYAQDDVTAARVKGIGSEILAQLDKLEIAMSTSGNACVWAERSRNNRSGQPEIELHAFPMKVALNPGGIPVALTSATMGRPEALVSDLGLHGRPDTITRALPSPWPIAQMGVCVVPRGAPAPAASHWAAWAEERMLEFVDLLGGGVLVLATSRSMARRFHQALMRRGVNARLQGEAGRTELLEWFRNNTDSVLVGTRSFFQGVDVPGNSLRGVVLDKIPFPVPTQLERAIGDQIKARGGSPFGERSLVQASTVLRQALGRLLRQRSDRGAALILDGRILSARYAGTLVKAINPLPLSIDMDDAARVLSGLPLQGLHTGPRQSRRRGIRVVAKNNQRNKP